LLRLVAAERDEMSTLLFRIFYTSFTVL